MIKILCKKASNKPNFNEIFELFTYHENLREKAQTNPDISLLKEAIKTENIFVIDLILSAKPELREHLNATINKSLLAFQDLIYDQGKLPAEIIMHIDKFVNFKNEQEKFNKTMEKFDTYKKFRIS